jgi:E3 ubiquitin-protein ligase EDD1
MQVVLFVFFFSDDLISLLDSGMHADHPSVIIDADSMFNEDMFGYSTLRRSGARSRSGERESPAERGERESMFRLRERRWLESALRDEAIATVRGLDRDRPDIVNTPEIKKSSLLSPAQSPVIFGEDLQFWPDRDGSARFSHIAAMHSELVAISTSGTLHQWKWMDHDPFRFNANDVST